MSERMVSLAKKQPGFLGFDSARGADLTGITVSYWDSLESIRRWKEAEEHREAQARGRAEWYTEYKIRIAKVESEYGN
jgi:heme-degrading monooxygenase HmoA